LLAGCPPCQGFSRMRTRNRKRAAKDDRNDLVLEFVRLAEGLLPKTILFENVPGLLHDERFDKLVRRLERKGFLLNYDTLNLAKYGIPQRRRRLILVASRLGNLSLPEAKGPERDVKWAIGSLPKPGESKDPLHSSLASHSPAVMERIKKIPKDGGSRADLGPDAQLPCHREFDGYRDVYGRMAWKKPSPTITRYSTNPSKGRYLHPEQDREISLREASLLQTFPSDYKFPLEEFGRGAVASMIGEALPPEFASQAGEHVKSHILTIEGLVQDAAKCLATLSPFENGHLPWRQERTPYRIFLAELLLIRTRADTVAAHYEEIYRRFPSVRDLATASQENVEEALAPLGFHKRVPFLMKAAEFIVDEYGGNIPSDPDLLIDIPGIGSYTAAAIAAFAFGRPVVPADVNILRFLSRLTGFDMKHKTKGSKQLRALLPLLSEHRGGPSAEVLLDFTRLICKPRHPLCTECVLKTECSFAQTTNHNIPDDYLRT
jgi:DNA (cytosine-5)-methyltransferase 1